MCVFSSHLSWVPVSLWARRRNWARAQTTHTFLFLFFLRSTKSKTLAKIHSFLAPPAQPMTYTAVSYNMYANSDAIRYSDVLAVCVPAHHPSFVGGCTAAVAYACCMCESEPVCWWVQCFCSVCMHAACAKANPIYLNTAVSSGTT